MKRLNGIVPSIDLWIISLVVDLHLDFVPLTTNFWAQQLSQYIVYVHVHLSSPYFSSFSVGILWVIVWNLWSRQEKLKESDLSSPVKLISLSKKVLRLVTHMMIPPSYLLVLHIFGNGFHDKSLRINFRINHLPKGLNEADQPAIPWILFLFKNLELTFAFFQSS